MGSDLLVMLYGAIMGVIGSIVTSIVTAVFQSWLERREYERRQMEERSKLLRQIHLPTDEEVRLLSNDNPPEVARTSAAAGAILVSTLLSSTLVYQAKDPVLSFLFGACLGHLATNRLIRRLRGG